ncbi:MAG: hypothetical protein LBT11_05205 [Treponema sp.]|jgi:hypothetical protein|nr:hypothetical protein [Treponema sp.]
MKRFFALALLLPLVSAAFGLGEETISLGGAALWGAAEFRQNITESGGMRPYPVLTLSAASGNARSNPDLLLSFDEGRPDLFRDSSGRYAVRVSNAVSSVSRSWARSGAGAANFSLDTAGIQASLGLPEPLVISPLSSAALFASNSSFRDFSIEFWLYPLTMENGEQLLSWSATLPGDRGTGTPQYIQCIAQRNRLRWNFQEFFASAGRDSRLNLSLEGVTVLTPRTWSHHLIRYDADTGLLEYLVNGLPESVTHTTPTGREGGEVYVPLSGEGSRFILGSRFSGLLDELAIYGSFAGTPVLGRYAAAGGRMETRIFDLGEGSPELLRLEAAGGRVSGAGERLGNEYAGSGNAGGSFGFADESAIRFFIRTSALPWFDAAQPWTPLLPGKDLGGAIQGRYVQLAAVFYPSADGETSPYLEELRMIYRPDAAPQPPGIVTAQARDGAVELSWRSSPDTDTLGYLVYYGTGRGDYFGTGARIGGIRLASPIDVGGVTSIRIEGLENGKLYFFAVAAYDRKGPAPGASGTMMLHAGEFSREVSARPGQAL